MHKQVLVSQFNATVNMINAIILDIEGRLAIDLLNVVVDCAQLRQYWQNALAVIAHLELLTKSIRLIC